ncbi:MAG: hypothetical protein K0R39_521 [Symbiobacteriaceae bacterium]|jgi:hypothetical protein|nr:hypothetical protein [Symbiobacteriaceae bacterium]
MDKALWRSISERDFAVPEGHTAAEYLPALFEGLGALDPELRDHLCLEVLWSWIDAGRFSTAKLRQIAHQMVTNLTVGIGETQGSAVFLRTFSVLILGAVVAYDTSHRVLSGAEVRHILGEGLAYLAAEHDLRGYVPVMGWAHSVAHTADLLTALAGHPELGAADLEELLYAMSDKVLSPTRQALVENEGFRLARAVVAILKRNLLPVERVVAWLDRIAGTEPRRKTFVVGQDNARYHNTEQFLASLHLMLTYKEIPAGVPEAVLPAIHRALKSFVPNFL